MIAEFGAHQVRLLSDSVHDIGIFGDGLLIERLEHGVHDLPREVDDDEAEVEVLVEVLLGGKLEALQKDAEWFRLARRNEFGYSKTIRHESKSKHKLNNKKQKKNIFKSRSNKNILPSWNVFLEGIVGFLMVKM